MTCVNHALKEAFVDVNRAYDKSVVIIRKREFGINCSTIFSFYCKWPLEVDPQTICNRIFVS